MITNYELENEKLRMLTLLERAEKMIKDAPSGTVYFRKNPGGSCSAYQASGSGKNRRRLLIPSQEIETIEKMCDSTLAQHVLPILTSNLKALEQAARYSQVDPMVLLNRFGEKFRASIQKLFQNEYTSAVNTGFSSLKERQNPYPMDKKAVTTEYGKFRSKSEAYEYEIMLSFALQVLYEPALIIGGRTMFPDFAVNRPWRGDIAIIEHDGLIDDPKYRARKLEDISAFMDNGYYPGINLLILSESAKDGFDIAMARKLIKAFCMP